MSAVWRHNLITIEFPESGDEEMTISNAATLVYSITSRTDFQLLSATLERTRGGVAEIIDAANYTLDLSAGTLTLNASIVAVDDSFALSYDYTSYLRLWTGRGKLTIAGKTYQGGGDALGVSELETASGEPDKRLQIVLSGIPAEQRARFLQDVGPLPVTVGWTYSQDQGAGWSEASVSFRGRLSAPSMSQGALTVELETQRGDVDRSRPLRWSHEDQQRRFPEDLGLEHMRALSQQGVSTSWPP